MTRPQQAADAALRGWEQAWGIPLDESEQPWSEPPSEGGPELPSPPPQMSSEHTPLFPIETGLGESGWHSRLWLARGRRGLLNVASVLIGIEAGAPWPSSQ